MPSHNRERTAAPVRRQPSDRLVRKLLHTPIVCDSEHPIAPSRHEYCPLRHTSPLPRENRNPRLHIHSICPSILATSHPTNTHSEKRATNHDRAPADPPDPPHRLRSSLLRPRPWHTRESTMLAHTRPRARHHHHPALAQPSPQRQRRRPRRHAHPDRLPSRPPQRHRRHRRPRRSLSPPGRQP